MQQTPISRGTALTTPPNQPANITRTNIQNHSNANFNKILNDKKGEDSAWLKTINLWSDDARDSDGHTLLHVAAFTGSIAYVEAILNLIESDRLVEFCSILTIRDRKTALCVACEQGHLPIVQKLFDLTKVSTDVKPFYAPIHVAAMNGHVDIVKYLVQEKHQNVNSQEDIYGFTPLHLAAQYGQVEMVNVLIDELGANKNLACKTERMLPIHTAIFNNNLEVLKALVHRHSKDEQQEHSKSYEKLVNDHIHINPLLLAIANTQENHTSPETLKASSEMVKFLVNELSADYSLRGNNGVSALHMASEAGNCDLINFFVKEKNEQVNQVSDVTHETPLYLAAVNDHLEAVQLLVSLGADRSIKNWKGFSVVDTLKELSSKSESLNKIYEFLSKQ